MRAHRGQRRRRARPFNGFLLSRQARLNSRATTPGRRRKMDVRDPAKICPAWESDSYQCTVYTSSLKYTAVNSISIPISISTTVTLCNTVWYELNSYLDSPNPPPPLPLVHAKSRIKSPNSRLEPQAHVVAAQIQVIRTLHHLAAHWGGSKNNATM